MSSEKNNATISTAVKEGANNRNARMPQRPDGRQAGIRPVAPYPGQQQFPHAADHYQYGAQPPAYNPFPQQNQFAVNLPQHAVPGNPQHFAPNFHPGSAVPLQQPAQRGSVSPPNDGSLPFHYVYSCGFCDEKLNSRNNKDALIEIYQDHYPAAAMCCKSGNEFVAELKNKYGGNLEHADRSKQIKKKPHCLIKECGIPLEIDGIERHFKYRHGLERHPVATTVSSPAPSSAGPCAQNTANLHSNAPRRSDTGSAGSIAPHDMAVPSFSYVGPSTTYGMPMGGYQQASYQSTAFGFPLGGSSMIMTGSYQSSSASATKMTPAQRQPPQAGVQVTLPSNAQSGLRTNAARTRPQPGPVFTSATGGMRLPGVGLSGSTNVSFVPSAAQSAPRSAVLPISNPASPAQVPRNRAFSSTVDFVSSLQDDMDPRDWQAPLSDQAAGSAVTAPRMGEAGAGVGAAVRNVPASSPQGSNRVASDGITMSATIAPTSVAPMHNAGSIMAKASSPSTVVAAAALAPVMQNLDILEVPRRYADGLRERSCDEEGRSPEDTTARQIPVPVAEDLVREPEVKEEPDVPKAPKFTTETTAETSAPESTPLPRTIPKLLVRKQMLTKAPTASKRARLEELDEDVLRDRNTRSERKKSEENRANPRRWICKCGDVSPSRHEFVEHWARHKPSTERLSRSQSALLCPRQFCGYLADSQNDFGRHVARHILMQQCYKEKAKEMQEKMNFERENM